MALQAVDPPAEDAWCTVQRKGSKQKGLKQPGPIALAVAKAMEGSAVPKKDEKVIPSFLSER